MKGSMKGQSQMIILLLLIALVITFISFMFPAVATFGGYRGITYHGFPIGWMGETTRGLLSVTNTYDSLQYVNYLIGFIVDVLFWFCVAFILFVMTLSQRSHKVKKWK